MATFGNLTLSVLSKDMTKGEYYLDYLFKNSNKMLSKMTVIESERQIAYENLKKLTSQLQTKRLRYNAKAACDYFTL